MKKTATLLAALAVLAAAAFAMIYFNAMTVRFEPATVTALERDVVRVIDVFELDADRAYAALYEFDGGVGVAYFERMPLLGRWVVKERIRTLAEHGIAQNYAVFGGDGGARPIALVYGQFEPIEDYNLPLMLRNAADGIDEKPKHTESEQGAIIWYLPLVGPSADPAAFQLYNGITGTVITQ